MSVQVQVHTLLRKVKPGDDDLAGTELVSILQRALERGGAPPSAVAIRGDRIDIVPLGPLFAAHMSPAVFIAGLTRSGFHEGGETEAVGLVGTFMLRNSPQAPGAPLAMVFLEWTDCRWWQWRALLTPGQPPSLNDDTETVLRAVDGTAKPQSLGGWWSLGRRNAIDLQFERQSPHTVH